MKKIIAKLALFSIISTLIISFSIQKSMAAGSCVSSNECAPDQYCQIEKDKDSGTCQISGLADTKFPISTLKLDNNEQPQKYFEDKENSPIVSFILSVIDFATIIIGSIAVILVIAGGFMLMFAQGKEQELTNAKDVLKYAIIGLVVTFLSYTIATFVQSIFLPAS